MFRVRAYRARPMCSLGTGFLWYEHGDGKSDFGEHSLDKAEAIKGDFLER